MLKPGNNVDSQAHLRYVVGRETERREGGIRMAVLSTFHCVGACKMYYVFTFKYKVERHLSGLDGKVRHPDKQKIRIIRFFRHNRRHWQLEVRMLIFTVCTCDYTLRTTPDLKF